MRFFIFPLLASLLIAASSNAAPAQDNAYSGVPISTTVFVTFENGATIFRPDADTVGLLSDAKNAALVAIRGRTSTKVPTLRDEALALARAASARAYLIARGVSPLKITINYASAADFIADNATLEGRLQNQRVEIDLIYVP